MPQGTPLSDDDLRLIARAGIAAGYATARVTYRSWEVMPIHRWCWTSTNRRARDRCRRARDA